MPPQDSRGHSFLEGKTVEGSLIQRLVTLLLQGRRWPRGHLHSWHPRRRMAHEQLKRVRHIGEALGRESLEKPGPKASS